MFDLQSEPPDRDGLDPSLRAAFVRRADSLVDALPQLRGRARHARLNDPHDTGGPLIDPHSREVLDAGHYRVDGEIARGGVGVVLKGHDVDLGRDVALKVLREEHLCNPDLVARFVEEAQIGGQLQHPGIVPVYGRPDARRRRLPHFLEHRAAHARERRLEERTPNEWGGDQPARRILHRGGRARRHGAPVRVTR